MSAQGESPRNNHFFPSFWNSSMATPLIACCTRVSAPASAIECIADILLIAARKVVVDQVDPVFWAKFINIEATLPQNVGHRARNLPKGGVVMVFQEELN